MGKIRVFLDTDVIISSLLSDKGASFEILSKKRIVKIISLQVQKETSEVSKRLGIRKKPSKDISVIKLGISKKDILNKYKIYVYDPNDAHVVSGADISDSEFLLTFNIRDYKIDKIKDSLGVIVMTPGIFLQYLRSLEKN